MEVAANLKVRPAVRGDISQLDELISRGHLVHRHMDWRAPLEWIDYSPFFVLEKNGVIISVMACPPDPTSIGWIRVFGIDASISVGIAWENLWQAIKPVLPSFSISRVAVITMGQWFHEILENSDFTYHQDIIVLNWDYDKSIVNDSDSDLPMRKMNESDLPLVENLDGLAFEPIWQNSTASLSKAFKMAAYSTVITQGKDIIAYQVSTQNLMGGHLARLAVHPEYQGRGIGKALVIDLMRKLGAKGAQRITVNTQSDNPASLALYRTLGFEATGEKYPVYVYDAKP